MREGAIFGRYGMSISWRNLAGAVAALLLLAWPSAEASAEARIYHLRVTLRSGLRYETISTYDPINYCHANGGSTVYMRDHFLIYSPEMKVKVLRSWIDPAPNLSERWRDVLRANKMLATRNHKRLARVEPLSPADMRTPE